MLQVLIGIIAIAVIVVIIFYVCQRRAMRVITDLRARLVALEEARLARRLDDASLADLMGESLKVFTALQDDYLKKVAPAVDDANEQLEEVSKNLNGLNVFTVTGQLNQVRELVEEAERQQKRVVDRLQKADQKEEEQKKATATMGEQLGDFQKKLDDTAYQYGDAIRPLRSQLADLQEQFTRFNEIAAKGDHEAAAEILTDLKEKEAHFTKLAEEIPELYKPLFTTFPDQISELREGYRKLVANHYRFPVNNLDDQIEGLEAQRQTALDHIAALSLAPVRVANKSLEEKIDHLYDVMQNEMDARPQVEKLVGVVGDHLDHARQQNRELMAELDRLSESYTLNHDEVAHTRELEEQLKQIQKEYEKDQVAVNAQAAVASQVLERFMEDEKVLTAIETQQKEINDGVAYLSEDEQRARKALQRFVTTVRATKRHVETLNLPGLPQDYLDFFFLVSDEISHLAKDMNQQRIDMEAITKELLKVQGDVSELIDRTNKVRDSAELTARLMQYGLRFVDDNQEIDAAITEAQKLYDCYEYEQSLETIGAALEKAEPGSFKRLEDNYYDELDEEES
ncbi:septation ring formation regulator EzrA [Limosilactobacillus fermentum]|uniref:septation ring formation regulator EzrA n=1 Tax=Limosilactobacillus fermentum TaxID=1613 RepID=UPI00019C647C|nr:septation ring formation regulator EzrA [Limosilactobacillus fermentum]EEI22442.1 septation ring formation regulator EzrA [Limosilactobacillus fermentum ATCC 14931]MCH5403141.1 septation ring formation regulator EzrA [Limosilactobacillus fermentum]MDC6124867.1 septation ring formation regulator EzrA [Limosilactobacillus fermentum]MDG9735412.1 septation ring formation regulator EzrA [Limosilactobacillus fermentum]QCJ28160.1 septation ring formation regulator EzrA [Limosilactobacillus ferment